MKILLRDFGDKQYEWVDAVYDDTTMCFRYDNRPVKETDIVSISEDNRNEFVKCLKCGQVFKKGSEEAKAHITPTTDSSKCFGCKHMRKLNANTISTSKPQLIDNNRYRCEETYEVDFVCYASYRYYGINTQEARAACVYNRCAGATIVEFSDFFTENPDAFDHIITVDRVKEVGFSDVIPWRNRTEYRLNIRNNVWAIANSLGIIDHFVIHYKRESYDVYYSKKYHKLYMFTNVGYKLWDPDDMPASSKTLILNKMAELYS